jgi:hypothetical protein
LSRKKGSARPFLIPVRYDEEWHGWVTEKAAELKAEHPELSEKAAMVAAVISLHHEGDMGLSHARVGSLTSRIMALVDHDFSTPETDVVATLKYARSAIAAYGYVNEPQWVRTRTFISLSRALSMGQGAEAIPVAVRQVIASTAAELWPSRGRMIRYIVESLDIDPKFTKEKALQLLDACILRAERWSSITGSEASSSELPP